MASAADAAAAVSSAFDAIAETYDARFTYSAIGQAQRASVWKEIDRTFRAGQRILEINCGTGIDALHMAGRGIDVVACDSAPGMIAVARRRSALKGVRGSIDFRVLATEHVAAIQNEKPFDGVLSNFAGLNCVRDLAPVACDLAGLVKPRSSVILCMFGQFCLWETAWYLARRNWNKAFRRFRRSGVPASLSPDADVHVWYPSPGKVQRALSAHFRLRSYKGVGIAVPPSYLEFFPARHPRLFRAASQIDRWLGGCAGYRAMADHMLLIFERNAP
jgi:ubiquinone/menaquinone biosynthesis C-methylase UbiE